MGAELSPFPPLRHGSARRGLRALPLAQSAVSGNPIKSQKEGFSEYLLTSISSSPRLCFHESPKELRAATTSLDDRRNGGVLDRHRGARFGHQLSDSATALLCFTGLCTGMVLR